MSATVVELRAELATLAVTTADRRAETTSLTSEQSERRSEYTDLEHLMTDRLAQDATLFQPTTRWELTENKTLFRYYYILCGPGLTGVRHTLMQNGRPTAPTYCDVTPQQLLPPGSQIYVEAYNDDAIYVRVLGDSPIRLNLFAIILP
jgi:hypothetical protein